MNNNDIKKEALISVRNNPFAGSKGWSGLFSAFGKGGLEKKSDSYKQAVRIMTEIDDNIRAAFKKQQQFAKEAYWGKFKMDLSRFAHAVNDFFNQQVIIITLADSSQTKGNLQALMSKVSFEIYRNSKWFGKLEKAPEEPEIYTDPDFDANEFTEIINEFNDEGALRWINHANEIIERRESDKKRKNKQPIESQTVKNLADKATEEEKLEEEESVKESENPTEIPGSEIGNKNEDKVAAAEVELYQELVKKGLLDSFHYKSLMRGRNLKKSMEKIFDLMQSTLDQSAGTLNIVSHAVNVGDPDEYIKEISKLIRRGNDAMVRIVPLWNEHFKDLVAKTEPSDPSEPSEPSDPSEAISTSQHSEVETSTVEAPPAEEGSVTPSDDQVSVEEYWSGDERPSEKKLNEALSGEADSFTAGTNLNPPTDESIGPAYDKKTKYYINLPNQKPALAFSKYIDSGDYKGLAEYIKKYANNVDDENLKLKLIAIAEEADE
ncbi:MAG TPA: hypothetical protein VMX17_13300 [Candidatus Glassbacteria bacterium]|nr:hypothetical protein [Candidatus Glassbacteria bacterium]